GREQNECGDVLVQVRAELRQLPPLAEQLSDPLLVTAALGDELLAPVALEVAPLLNEDGGDVELLGDDPEVAAQRESDLLRRRQVLGDRVEGFVEGGGALPQGLVEEVLLRGDVGVERALLDAERVGD